LCQLFWTFNRPRKVLTALARLECASGGLHELVPWTRLIPVGIMMFENDAGKTNSTAKPSQTRLQHILLPLRPSIWLVLRQLETVTQMACGIQIDHNKSCGTKT
jgi:hypothetical protein